MVRASFTAFCSFGSMAIVVVADHSATRLASAGAASVNNSAASVAAIAALIDPRVILPSPAGGASMLRAAIRHHAIVGGGMQAVQRPALPAVFHPGIDRAAGAGLEQGEAAVARSMMLALAI